MLTFPDPNVETEYTDPNGSVWEFNGTGWVRQCDCPDGGGGGDGSNPDPIEPDGRFINTRCVINGEFGEVGGAPIDATGKTIISPSAGAKNIADAKYGNGGVSLLKADNGRIAVPIETNFWRRPWTLEGWFQFKSQAGDASNAYNLFGSWDTVQVNGTNAKIFMLRANSSKQFELLVSYDGVDGDVNMNINTGADLWDDPDRWYHVAVSHEMNSKLINVYLDGVRLKSQPITQAPQREAKSILYVGDREGRGGNQGDFHMDDFRLTYDYCRYNTDEIDLPGQVQYQQTYASAVSGMTFLEDYDTAGQTEDNDSEEL
jgi:hypothetical protein